jgi:hypothetical protein
VEALAEALVVVLAAVQVEALVVALAAVQVEALVVALAAVQVEALAGALAAVQVEALAGVRVGLTPPIRYGIGKTILSSSQVFMHQLCRSTTMRHNRTIKVDCTAE